MGRVASLTAGRGDLLRARGNLANATCHLSCGGRRYLHLPRLIRRARGNRVDRASQLIHGRIRRRCAATGLLGTHRDLLDSNSDILGARQQPLAGFPHPSGLALQVICRGLNTLDNATQTGPCPLVVGEHRVKCLTKCIDAPSHPTDLIRPEAADACRRRAGSHRQVTRGESRQSPLDRRARLPGHVVESGLNHGGAAPYSLCERDQHRRVHHHENRVQDHYDARRRVAVVEHGRWQHLVQDDVVDGDGDPGNDDRQPVVVKHEHGHTDEDMEMPLDESSAKVNDDARVQHQHDGANCPKDPRIAEQRIRHQRTYARCN